MAKNIKLNIKNTQIAQAIDLGGLKSKHAKSKIESEAAPKESDVAVKAADSATPPLPSPKEETSTDAPRIRARSKSAFAESGAPATKVKIPSSEPEAAKESEVTADLTAKSKKAEAPRQKTSEELRKEIFKEELKESSVSSLSPKQESLKEPANLSIKDKEISLKHVEPLPIPQQPKAAPMPPLPTQIKAAPETSEVTETEIDQKRPPRNVTEKRPAERESKFSSERSDTQERKEKFPAQNLSEKGFRHGAGGMPREESRPFGRRQPQAYVPPPSRGPTEKLGPTGRHVNDLLPKRPPARQTQGTGGRPEERREERRPHDESSEDKSKPKAKPFEAAGKPKEAATEIKKDNKSLKAKEFRDVRPATRKTETRGGFDARDRQGLRATEDDRKLNRRKKRLKPQHQHHEDITVRPTSLKVRMPITIKDLAAEMKLKASQLIAKLFMQGLAATLNDSLDDETTIQLLGHEFGCEITIDTAEEERLRVTDKSIREEIAETDPQALSLRPPVVAFMGHVDHGKTSLIDYIRKSNRAAGEAGAITQHIGAFKCHTSVGDLAILDTPGHEAFSSMRARGADVTDIVVLVVAGDEGMQQQTVEALQHAKAANVSIVVAINKCDKPNFNPETVYRQLSENDLLPESWGGQTITVNCSAVTGEGIQTLLEMLALQAEVLELKANPSSRARGTVLESEMHKGMGSVATVLVQNGTLRLGDALVFGQTWGRVKTMYNEAGRDLKEAGPSTPIEITGLSGLPDAGEEFITVKNEREAREIAEGRMQGIKQTSLLKKKLSLENIFQQASDGTSKKILNIVLRADVQGSLEALKVALMKIVSTKAELNIIFAGVGEISESDVQLAAASKAIIVGFHTQVESHADSLVKELGVQVRSHDIIYHAIDDVRALLAGLLDKIAVETEKGKAIVKATFKSSQYGIIAGCQVTEGSIHRNHQVRVRRGKEVVWKGTISSLKRVKEDVREVSKGLECGIVLNGFSAYQEDDVIESYEITYIIQEL